MKIALIGMSGVRAYNQELIDVGMSLPGFAERATTISSLPSLGLLTLAGMTPDRHEVSYHEVADLDGAGEIPNCDLAAISFLTSQALDAYSLADRLRAEGISVVLGGLHATARPHEALEHGDAVVAGEGELSWLRVLDDFELGRLEGVYGGAGEFDLACAPMPAFELLEPERYNRITVQTQRGCPWRCEFCASSVLLTKRYKMKPVARVIAEVRAVRRVWPQAFIEFADDNTFVDKRRGKELMRALAPEHVRWFTETDLSVADDLELLDLMREAGCAQVLIGLESPRPEDVRGIEGRRDWKYGRAAGYLRALERIHTAGITVNGCFVLGLDSHDPAIFEEVVRFVEESGLADVQVTVLTPFPGTPVYERLKREGRLLHDGEWGRFTLFDVNFRPAGMTVSELERGLVEGARRLYTPEAKRRRQRMFVQQVRRGRTDRKAGRLSA